MGQPDEIADLAAGELSRPARIDKPELHADLTPEGSAVVERALRQNGLQTRLRGGRRQCIELRIWL